MSDKIVIEATINKLLLRFISLNANRPELDDLFALFESIDEKDLNFIVWMNYSTDTNPDVLFDIAFNEFKRRYSWCFDFDLINGYYNDIRSQFINDLEKRSMKFLINMCRNTKVICTERKNKQTVLTRL